MRILVPGPRFEDSFTDNVADTLCRMGHEVRFSQPTRSRQQYFSRLRTVGRMAYRVVRGAAPSLEDYRLWTIARSWRPQLLLALTWDVHPEILDSVGRLGLRRVLWWGDTPANSQGWGLVNPGWDHVYCKDPDAVDRLRLVGVRANLLHEAMNPRWHRVVATQKTDSVVTVGNYYAYRQALIERLWKDEVSVVLYGSTPPRWASPAIHGAWTGEYVTRERKSQVFGEALACLNTFALSEGQSLNCRAFEIAGAGGLQLIAYRPVVEQCFEPDQEILAFRTYEELREQIDRVRTDRTRARRTRDAGARRARAEHTYEHRLRRILDDLG